MKLTDIVLGTVVGGFVLGAVLYFAGEKKILGEQVAKGANIIREGL